MKEYSEAELEEAHKHSAGHKEEIISSEVCGCFYCRAIFKPHAIKEWGVGRGAGWIADSVVSEVRH